MEIFINNRAGFKSFNRILSRLLVTSDLKRYVEEIYWKKLEYLTLKTIIPNKIQVRRLINPGLL